MNTEEIEQLKKQVQDQKTNIDQSLSMNGMEKHTARKYLWLIGLPILLLLIGILIILLYLRLTAEPIETSTEDLQELPSLSTNGTVEGSLVVNIPTVYEGSLTVKQLATFEGGIVSPGLITSITTGAGLTSTGGQDPVISNTGVLSLAGETGELDLIAGTGITIDGLTISSTVTEDEDQDVFRTIASGGISFSASGANDTLTFTAGDGIQLSTDAGSKTITISNTSSTDLLASPDGSGVTSSYSGLEFGGANDDELTLIQGCANGELLKWNTGTQMWECGQDIGGLSNAVVNVKEGDVLVSSTVDTLDFSGADFSLTESPAGEINIVIDYASSFITRSNQNEVITGDWEFDAVEVTNGLLVSGGDLNLATGNVYQINGTSVLSNNTLGTGITTSSLTTVGALTSGSIGSGFGSILTTNTITGSTINATTGINTGAGAGTLRINNAGNLVNIGTTQFNGVTYTWPGSDAVGSGYVLTSNGSGGLAWQEVSGIGGVGDITGVGDVVSGAAFTTGGTGSSLYFHDSGFEGEVTVATLTGNHSYTLPDSTGTFCLTSGNCSGTGAGIGGSGTTNYVAKFSDTYALTDSSIYDDGNVGIGTATPGYKLDVAGTFYTSGLATFLSGVSVNSETITDFTGSGLQINAGSLETTLGTDIDLTSEVTGVLPVDNGGTGANSFTAGGILYGNGTSPVGASSAGNAGQVLTSGGAGSPTWIDASTVGTNYWQQNLGALAPLNTSNDLLLGSNATSSAIVRLPGITGENAFFNLGTGNVGIGTTTPTAGKLQVVYAPGTYASGIQNSLRIEATGVGIAAGDSNVRTLSFSSTMTGANNASELTAITGDVFNSKSSGTLTTQQGNSVNLRVTNASNTSNAYGFRTIPTLTGAGNINNYRGFEARTPSISSTGVIATAYGMYIDAHQITGVTTGYGLYQAGSTDTNYFAGSIGIGDTTPTFKLDVNGTIRTTGNAVFEGTGEVWGTLCVGLFCSNDGTVQGGSNLTLQSKDNGSIRFNITSGNEIARFTEDGLAIGLTSPGAYMLNVNGDSNITGDLNITADITVDGTTTLNSVAYTWPSSQAGGTDYILANDGSGNLSWLDPGSLPNNDLWQRNAGAIAPTNITDDVLTGATATSSAIVKLPGLTNQDAFFNLGTGNVGIGTTTPTNAKLDISGSAFLTGTLGALGTATNANYGLNLTLTDDQRGVNTTATLTTAADNAYGAFNTLSFSNGSAIASGIIAGTRNVLNLAGNTSGNNAIYGTYNTIDIANTNNAGYGTYNSFTRTASGSHYGLYNQFGTQTQISNGYGMYNIRQPATQSITSQYGMYNRFQNLYTMTGAYNDFDITNGTTNNLRGVHNEFTIGATNANTLLGVDNDFTLTNYGNVYGMRTIANLPGISTGYGVHNDMSLANSASGGNLYGFYNDLTNNGGTASRNVYGLYNTFTTLNTGNTYGMYTAQDAASTGGTVYGVYLNLNDADTTRWGIYEAGGATNYFAGSVGIGTTTPSTFKLEMTGSIGPSADDTYDLGSDTRRWRDVYVGPASLHIGNSGDDVTLSYDLANDRLSINKGIYIDGDAIFNSGTQLNGVDYTWPGADGSNGYILTTDGSGALTWIDPGSLPNNDVWQRNLGAVSPLNVTDDILSGATATSSAIVRVPGLTNQNAWFNLGTGNLGIGTTNPVHKLELASGTTAAEGIGFGTDVELYRSTTNTLALASGDSFNIISGALQIAGTTAIDSSRNANFASSVTLGADAVLSRGAANRFDLASGDSLNIVSGNLQIAGTTAVDSSRNASFATSLTLGGDAVLSRGAANRFDLASGDSLNLVSGSMQIGGTDVITSGRLVLAADGAANAPGFAFASDATNGMFLAGLDQLAFSTAGTESMRILANGNVGIGNTNPGDKLVVNGNISISGTNGSFIASIGDASPHNDPVYTFTGDTDTGMFRAASNQLGFSTSGAEAMRIIANGNVGIGVTNPGAMLEVEGTVRFTDLTTGTSNLAVCMNSSTGEIIQSSALNCTTSSQRYKSNIQDLDAGLAQVLELRPRSYVRDSSGLTEIGLIAEEVENIDSRLVFYNNEGLIEGVHYENLTALLAKGIQELDAKIATLNSSIPDIVASSSAEFDLGENIEADFAAFDFTSISSDLTVLGTTTLREASITDTLAVGAGELVITSSSINTLSETLELQSLAQAPVSIMAGAVEIQTDGKLIVRQDAIFEKNVDVAGALTTSQILLNKSDVSIISDTEVSASASAGTSFIKAGQTERKITNPHIKSDSLIYITPLSDTEGMTPFVSEQSEGDASTSASFTVTIKEDVTQDIQFNFLIINQK